MFNVVDTHTHTDARTHTPTHARTHARTHTMEITFNMLVSFIYLDNINNPDVILTYCTGGLMVCMLALT